jgi:hypothetical protein
MRYRLVCLDAGFTLRDRREPVPTEARVIASLSELPAIVRAS